MGTAAVEHRAGDLEQVVAVLRHEPEVRELPLEPLEDRALARRVVPGEVLPRLDLGDALETSEAREEQVEDLVVDDVELEAEELELLRDLRGAAHDRTASQAPNERHRQTHSTVLKPAAERSSSFQRAVTGTSTPSRLAAFRSISSREYPFRSLSVW